MVKHIVLFKLKRETTEEEIEKLQNELRELTSKISGISDYAWGPNMSSEQLDKGYTHGFIMTFATVEQRDVYVVHPLHKEVIRKYIDPICEEGLVFDIEAN